MDATDSRALLDRIGNTPLLRFQRVRPSRPGVELLAKAEWFNPGGSVKDRAALAMVRDGEAKGLLTPQVRILDATSGNTGIAYAMIGAALGYGVTLCLPSNASSERLRILRALGAELVLTSPLEGTDGAQRRAKEEVAAQPGRFYYPDQYNNAANWRAHHATTAEEIWRQTGGAVTHFVCGIGTTGTFVGTTRRLRELQPRLTAIAVAPDGPLHGLEGMKHLPSALVPGIWDPGLPDRTIEVATEDAQAMCRRLAREEGILVGPSGGAAVSASLRLGEELETGTIVTVLPDSGTRYLDQPFWEEEGKP